METTTVSKNIIDASAFDLNLLTVFCLIYNTGGVSSTAQILNISPSAVSQSLKKLRHKFNDHLFIRNGNDLLPTLFATELYQATNDIIMKVGFFVSKNSELHRTKIVIGTTLTLGLLVMPQISTMILTQYPDVNLVHYEETASDSQIKDKLNLRQVDIIFSPAQIETTTLTSKKITTMRYVLVSGNHDIEESKHITLEKLRQVDLVSINGIGDMFIYYRHEFQRRYQLKPRRILTSSIELMVQILSTSNYMGFLPENLLMIYKQKYPLHVVECDVQLPAVNIYMTYRKEMEEQNNFHGILSEINNTLRC